MLEAIRLQPKRPFLLSNLGAILSDIGRHDEAIGYLRHARVRFPSNVDIRYNLALGYYRVGRFSEATVELLGILELDPNQWEAVVLLQHIGRSPPKGKEMTPPPPQAR
jgi:tetratricopeptide (TPR) repeat protein